MFKYIMCLVLVLVPTFAVAQESEGDGSLTPEEQSKQFCETRFSGTGLADVLKRLLCIQHEHTRILEARQKRGEAGLEQKLAELRKQLSETQDKLAKLAQAQPPQNPNPPAGPSSDPSPTPQPQGPSLPAFVNGVQFGVMEMPGQFAATTWNIPGIDFLWIQDLKDGVRRFLDRAQQVRVVVRKNGVVIPIAHADTSKRFDEFYADLNNDGKPDSRPYKGLDPYAVGDVYVSDVRPEDKIEVIYLTRTRYLVTIQGLPPQILWGRPVVAKMDATSAPGRRRMAATTAAIY